jgi:putative tryptophan/tyrosine transport system substrate-binding protein
MRRTFLKRAAALSALGLSPLAWPQAAKPFRIYGVMWRGKTQVETGIEDYFGEQGIQAEFTWRDAAQTPARLEGFAREIKELRPDLVVTWGTTATLGIAGPHDAANPQRYVTDIPLLFAMVADPVGAKVVSALRGHGRDITGVYHVAPLSAQVETMRTYRKFDKVGVIYNAAEANSVSIVASLKRLAATQRFGVVDVAFDRDADGKPLATGIPEKIAALKQAGAEWLYLGPDTYLFSQLAPVAAAALEQRLATFSATEAVLNARAPVLTGLVSSYYLVGQFAGFKAAQVLQKRMKARDVPIETLSRYSFIVRMEVAKQLDILPPVALFNYAIVK